MSIGRQKLADCSTRLSCTLIGVAMLIAFADARTSLASCGDYVMVGGKAHPSHDDGAGDSLPGIPTCHGPQCQRQAPLPVVPTKTFLSGPSAEAAYIAESAADRRPSLSGWLCERQYLLAEGHAMPLLRPPCL